MRSLHVRDFRTAYASLVQDVATAGEPSVPRGLPTTEVLNYVVTLDDLRAATFPSKVGRGVSPRVLSAELLQWLGGVSDLAQLEWASKAFAQFSDDGDRLEGAYGPRTHAGLERAVRLLCEDDSTRQATVSVWGHHEPTHSKDVPCTVSWSFLLRRGRLHMTTFMRSNDVWRGIVYDLPIMARIGAAVAWAMGVTPGTYTHHAQSLHVYESDLKDLAKLETPDVALSGKESPPFFEELPSVSGSPLDRWEWLTDAAVAATRGHVGVPDLDWYSEKLDGSARHPYFCDRCRYFIPSPELVCPVKS